MRKRKKLAVAEESKLNVDLKKRKKADWADLPDDILRLIMEKLIWSDTFRMSLSCKRWQDCLREIGNTQEFLPWVMSYDWGQTSDGGGICKLFDPAAKKTYNFKQAPILENRDLCGALPCDSRNGWVLFSKAISNARCFYFYCPFTNEVIELPKLENEHYRRATFSLSPTSLGCTVIALSIQKAGKFEIETCHPGDKSWKVFKLKFFGKYQPYSVSQPVYAGESFYCIFSNGKMGAFNIKNQQWKVLSGRSPVMDYYYHHLVVAFNGDLLLCYCGPAYRSSRRRCSFWRFDISKTKWFPVADESKKKQVIFRDGASYSLSVPAAGNAKESAGKIYYVGGYQYPLLTNFCIQNDSGALSKDYKCLKDHKLFHVWIQPPFQINFKSFPFTSI